MQKTKKVRVGKCTSQELFIAMSNVNNKLLNKAVKNKDCISIPVIHLFQATEAYIPPGHDKMKAGKGGEYLLNNFLLHDLGHTKLSNGNHQGKIANYHDSRSIYRKLYSTNHDNERCSH
jgi:hypothetical protein